jgi:tetratricopeptide (TPR) repeat protein
VVVIDFKAAHDRRQVVAAFQAGEFGRASFLASRLLNKNKNDMELQHIYGLSCLNMGRHAEARRVLQKLLAVRANDPALLADIAYSYLFAGEIEQAHSHYDKALQVAPTFKPAIAGKASAFDRAGDYESVERLIKPIMDAQAESPAMAVTYARMLQHYGRHEEAAALATRHLANTELDPTSRHFLCEMAAKSFEKLGQFDRAFAAFSDSNALKALPFSPQEYVAGFDDLIATFSKANLVRLPRSRLRSDLPIFIASMPRSGSTLVEQIIHAHPQAHGAGEIPEFEKAVTSLQHYLGSMQPYPACLGDFKQSHADDLAKTYLDELRAYDQRAKRITNKHLNNYHRLGMVELLLPGARVVHVKRDPLDNCFSIFMAQISTFAYPWSTDLGNVALAHRQYERMMAHWHEVLSTPILDVQYEDLVEDTETWIRRIIDFCGLPWDDKCLRYYEADRSVMTLSYDQVRKPIYKSAVKRYEKYDQFLGPLKEELARGTSGAGAGAGGGAGGAV